MITRSRAKRQREADDDAVGVNMKPIPIECETHITDPLPVKKKRKALGKSGERSKKLMDVDKSTADEVTRSSPFTSVPPEVLSTNRTSAASKSLQAILQLALLIRIGDNAKHMETEQIASCEIPPSTTARRDGREILCEAGAGELRAKQELKVPAALLQVLPYQVSQFYSRYNRTEFFVNFFWKEEVEAAKREFESLSWTRRERWLYQRKLATKRIMEDSEARENEEANEMRLRAKDKRDIQLQRIQEVERRVAMMTQELDEHGRPYYDMSILEQCPSYHQSKRIVRVLTERAWQMLRNKLIREYQEELEECRRIERVARADKERRMAHHNKELSNIERQKQILEYITALDSLDEILEKAYTRGTMTDAELNMNNSSGERIVGTFDLDANNQSNQSHPIRTDQQPVTKRTIQLGISSFLLEAANRMAAAEENHMGGHCTMGSDAKGGTHCKPYYTNFSSTSSPCDIEQTSCCSSTTDTELIDLEEEDSDAESDTESSSQAIDKYELLKYLFILPSFINPPIPSPDPYALYSTEFLDLCLIPRLIREVMERCEVESLTVDDLLAENRHNDFIFVCDYCRNGNRFTYSGLASHMQSRHGEFNKDMVHWDIEAYRQVTGFAERGLPLTLSTWRVLAKRHYCRLCPEAGYTP